MQDLRGRQELYNGFGTSMSRAVELVVSPLVFGLIGLLVDHLLGITPILTIVFAMFAIAGTAVKMYFVYNHDMQAQSAGKPWDRGR